MVVNYRPPKTASMVCELTAAVAKKLEGGEDFGEDLDEWMIHMNANRLSVIKPWRTLTRLGRKVHKKPSIWRSLGSWTSGSAWHKTTRL